MLSAPFPRRMPRGGVDPLTTPADALALLGSVVSRPWRTETIVVPLDAQHRGREVVAITGIDDLAPVLERLLPALRDAGLRAQHVLAASVLTEPAPVLPDGAVRDGVWADRWLAAADTADQLQCPLLEWFVLGPGGPWCPRDLLGIPPRWRRSIL